MMSAIGLPHLRAWRDAHAMSVAALSKRASIEASRIEALEDLSADYCGAELLELAAAFNCDAWRFLQGPPDTSLEARQRTKIAAQLMRDICVEAVTTYDDMGRLNDLKVSMEAEVFWEKVADLFSQSVASISRKAASAAPSVLAKI